MDSNRPRHRPKDRPRRPHPKAKPHARVPSVDKGPKPIRPSPGPQTHWGEVADWYDRLVGDEGSEYHQKVVHPGVVRLLGLSPGDPVIDVACGQGVLCRVLAERGAEVTGVDAAEPLIRAA